MKITVHNTAEIDRNTTTINHNTGTPQTELRIDTVRPLIESVFERITEEQWRLLTLGSPDDATKVLAAELLLDVIASVTNTLLTALKAITIPESWIPWFVTPLK